ncbi:MAG: type II toxin-antitoxin system RelE/ParE family toxin [Terracidiphilus sp.]
MPRLRWSRAARLDVIRLYKFLASKDRDAAARAVQAIHDGVRVLGRHPAIGCPADEMPPEFREWIVDFGQGCYVLLYRFDGKEAVILAIRHGREAGY